MYSAAATRPMASDTPPTASTHPILERRMGGGGMGAATAASVLYAGTTGALSVRARPIGPSPGSVRPGPPGWVRTRGGSPLSSR